MDDIVARALKEDLGPGDVTVDALVPADLKGTAIVTSKQDGVLAGTEPAVRTFALADASLSVDRELADGAVLRSGARILTVRGPAASLLKAERTALNFLQHLSGVATQTASFVKAVKETNAVILDTRKTTPGLRILEKAAVLAGGGANHRIGLFDMVLVKDNHLSLLEHRDESEAVEKAVSQARSAVKKGTKIEVEVATTPGALAAARAGADMVLLDNMSPFDMSETVRSIDREFGKERPLLEASGGITLNNVKVIAETGVDRISVGALTHSVTALDIAMYMSFD